MALTPEEQMELARSMERMKQEALDAPDPSDAQKVRLASDLITKVAAGSETFLFALQNFMDAGVIAADLERIAQRLEELDR